MRKLVIAMVMILLSLSMIVAAQDRGNSDRRKIDLKQTIMHKPHLMNLNLDANYLPSNGNVEIAIANYNASYTIRLTPSDGGDDIVVAATSPTITIPITNTTADYVVTVDGGDYGVYDGLLSPTGKDSVTLTDTQVMRLVKNRREINTAVDFYSATVSSIINDNRCPIDTMPSVTWATDTTISKWLIYVNEHPKLHIKHDCNYYYIPKEVNPQDSIIILKITGNGPSPQAKLKPLSFTFDPSCQHRVDFRNIPPRSGGLFENPIANDMKVVIYGAEGYEDTEDYVMRWHECCAFYNILTQIYNVPKSNIYVVMPDFNNLYDLGDNTLSYDFDGDGIDEFDGITTIWDVIEDSIGNQEMEHFVFYYACNFMYRYHYLGEPLYFYDIPESILDVNAEYKNYILSCYSADKYAEPFEATNSVITFATIYDILDPYPSGNLHDDYYQFPFCWLSVLSGVNLDTGYPITNDYDLDHNGHLSMKELQLGAKAYAFSLLPSQMVDSTLNVIAPERLANQISFDGEPQVDVLTVHQSDANTPSPVTWDSPDIWIRKTDDGLVHQQNECFTVTSGDSIYVYVRVHNEGNVAYNSNDIRLHLFWEAPHLGEPGCIEEFMDYQNLESVYGYRWKVIAPNKIASKRITETILPGQHAIIKYKWGIPDSVVCLGNELGNMLAVNMGVLINHENSVHFASNSILRKSIIQKNNVVICEDYLPTLTIPAPKPWMAPQIFYDGKFKMVIYPNDMHFQRRNLILIGDTAATLGNVFTSPVKPYIQPYNMCTYSNTVNVTPLTYAQYKLGLNGLNSQILGITAIPILEAEETPEDDGTTMYFGCSKSNSINAFVPIDSVNQTIHLVPVDTLGNYYEGQTIRFIVHEYNPSGGGVLNSVPDINSIDMSNGNYSLMETNVNEPARYEWMDGGFEKFGEGKSIVASKNEIGDYAVLKVTLTSDGREQYAVAALDGVPAIASVTPVPFDSQISVNLTAGAVAGMSVRIVSVLGTTQPIEQVITSGNNNVVVNTASLPAGQYVVTLLHNNEVVNSVNIIK